VGKTTLLRAAVDAAGEAGWDVVQSRAVPSETALPFSVASDLLRPLLDLHQKGLPEPQQRALTMALGLADGDGAWSTFTAYLGALSLLGLAAERKPVLVAVDDLHWSDAASRELLAFLARRVSEDRVVLLLGARQVDESWTQADEVGCIELGGLDDDAAAAMLAAHGEAVATKVLGPLVTLSTGNPLVLLETARQLSPGQRAGHARLPSAPALGPTVRRAWSARLQALPDETRAALLVLATWYGNDRASFLRCLDDAGLSAEALDPALDDGLLTIGDRGHDFFHPLMRRFVLDSSTPAVKREVYAMLAGCGNPDAEAWYLAAATEQPSDDVARRLEATADSARRRHGFAEASAALRRAAELSEDDGERSRRLVGAATDALLAGRLQETRHLSELGLQCTDEPNRRADLFLLRGRAEMWAGEVGAARTTMLAGLQGGAEVDAVRTVAILGESTLPSVMAARIDEAMSQVDRCLELAAASDLPGDLRVLLAQAMITAGQVPRATEQLDSALPQLDGADPVAVQGGLAIAAQCLSWLGRYDESRAMFGKVVAVSREANAPSLLPYALGALSELDRWQGRWEASYANATEALQWGRELGHVGTTGFVLTCLARLEAARGDRATCAERVREVRRTAVPLGNGSLETYADATLGLAALSAGDVEAATDHLCEAHRAVIRHDLTPTVVPYAGDLADALARGGAFDEVMELAEWLDRYDMLAWPRAMALGARGLVEPDHDLADGLLAASLDELTGLDLRFEVARVNLWRGQRSRHARRLAAARGPLCRALTGFESVGAEPWVRTTLAELSAAGAPTDARSPTRPLAQLTPQELQVASLVAEGRNNVETAAALFMSRKTVEAHLTRVYRKLGLRSRTELVRELAGAASPVPRARDPRAN
jgi:DNA-binding CsgD family transcriptional regulator/tetratricopeptide (TPR) repeat protein